MAIMTCPECGHEFDSTASKCPNCGQKITSVAERPYGEYICCPRCNSSDLRATRPYENGHKALDGAVVVGGVGILVGTIKDKNVDLTCLKCGKGFKEDDGLIARYGDNPSDLESDIVGMLKEGRRMEAVARYKKEKNTDLKTALSYIVELSNKYNLEPPKTKKGTGCAAVIALFMVLSGTLFLLL